jgi:HPt (histidine-containing phosphotransfer) domain-containing protein
VVGVEIMAEISAFDRAAALELVDGRRDVLAELAQTFLEHYPTLLQAVEDAVERFDGGAAAKAAHDLQGALAFFGPTRAGENAAELERRADAADLPGMGRSRRALRQSIKELVAGLRQLGAAQ